MDAVTSQLSILKIVTESSVAAPHRKRDPLPSDGSVAIKNEDNTEKGRADYRLNSAEDMKHLTKSINEYLEANQTDLRIEINRKINTPVFKIVRRADKKVIKEVPPKEMQKIAERIQVMAGTIMDSTA